MKNYFRIFIALFILSLIGAGIYFFTLSNHRITVSEGEGDCVILIHGLSRSSDAMAKMSRYLQSEGYETINLDYPSIRHDIQALTDGYLKQTVDETCQDPGRKINFVGHSLGGILIRNYLSQNEVKNLGRAVLIATPNHGSELADKLMQKWFYRFTVGPVLSQLGTDQESFPNTLPAPNFAFGIIAGTRDGKVSLESTKLEGMKDFLEVDEAHTFITNSIEVQEAVHRFLKSGEF